MSDVARLLTFGLGGHHVHYDNGSLSGYHRPETFQTDPSYGLRAGTPVIDKTVSPHIVAVAISGPLLCTTLPSGTMRTLFGAEEPYEAKRCGCMTQVALDVYLQIWRDGGARMGIWDGQRISWEGEAD
jgi:hypothetical protein